MQILLTGGHSHTWQKNETKSHFGAVSIPNNNQELITRINNLTHPKITIIKEH